MSNVKELREKIINITTQQRAILDTADKEQRALSSDENASYERMDEEYVSLKAELELAEAQEQTARQRSAQIAEREAFLNERVSKELPKSNIRVDSEDEYKRAFFEYIKSGNVRGNTVLSTSPDAQGGYLVPPTFVKKIQDELKKKTIIRQLANIIRTQSLTNIPIGKGKPVFGWIDENGEFQQTDMSFGQISLGAHKLGGFIKLSEEFLRDSAVDIESYVLSALVDASSALQEEAFLNGNGTKQPTGVLNATVGVTTAKAKEVSTDELLDLMYSLKSSYRTNAVWLISDSLELVLRKLKDNDGQYIWQQAITAGAPNMLFGKPVYVSDYMPAVGANAKAAVFGDFSYYTIADRGSYEMLRLNEVFALNGQVGFRASARVDAKITDENAFRVLKCHA